MMSITFHLLENNDFGLKQTRELNELYAEVFAEEEIYSGHKPSDLYLKKHLSKDGIIVCTAMSGERVVGGLTAYVMDKLEQETCEIYIYDLAVDGRFRRQKMDTNLLGFLLEEAKRRNASAVFIQADQEDTPAVALYESMGEREEVYHFDIYLKKED